MGRLTLAQVATAAAKRYAGRCSWVLFEDCLSVANLACTEARRTWKEDRGTPLDAYAWRACIFALRRFVWKASAPVTAPDKKLTELAEVSACELTDTPLIHVSPEDVIDTRRWVARVCARLHAIVRDDLGLEALLTDEKPAEVAHRRDIPVSRVYAAKRRAKDIVSADETTHQLWRELWN